MTSRAFPIPSWAPVAAAVAIVLWAASIWWMVATLPTGGDTSTIEAGLSMIADELEEADTRLDALTLQIASLEAERDALTARLDELETKPGTSGAFEMSVAGDAGAEEATADATDDGTDGAPEVSRFFTDGEDRYNCRDFASQAEAQEAFRVNGPGDPNRIDMNGNGLACEDIRYATPTPAATPTPTP